MKINNPRSKFDKPGIRHVTKRPHCKVKGHRMRTIKGPDGKPVRVRVPVLESAQESTERVAKEEASADRRAADTAATD